MEGEELYMYDRRKGEADVLMSKSRKERKDMTVKN